MKNAIKYEDLLTLVHNCSGDLIDADALIKAIRNKSFHIERAYNLAAIIKTGKKYLAGGGDRFVKTQQDAARAFNVTPKSLRRYKSIGALSLRHTLNIKHSRGTGVIEGYDIEEMIKELKKYNSRFCNKSV